MARTTFSRTVVITVCTTTYFDHDNVMHKDVQVELFGDYDLNGAQNAVKKKLKVKGAIVSEVSHKSFYGTLSLEEFCKHCSKKNFKEW